MKASKILVPIFAAVAGFIGGAVFENTMMKKNAEKLVNEAWSKKAESPKEVKMEENSPNLVKNMEKFEEVSRLYRSSEDEKDEKNEEKHSAQKSEEIVTRSVEIVGNKNVTRKEGAADLVVPFRERHFASGARICKEAEYRNAEEREHVDYYTGDDFFYDQGGNVIEDWEHRFGSDVLDYLGTTSDSIDLVHIYNSEEDVFYEIQRHMGYFDPK